MKLTGKRDVSSQRVISTVARDNIQKMKLGNMQVIDSYGSFIGRMTSDHASETDKRDWCHDLVPFRCTCVHIIRIS